jgi:hypothetical protein
MVEAGAFDGWGSSLIGGAVGALVAVLAAWLAYLYAEKSRKDAERADAAQRRADELESARQGLMIQISNLRDMACSKREGPLGSFALFPMRNFLFVVHTVLNGLPAYADARDFYDLVWTWRSWARDHKPPSLPSTRRPDEQWREIRDFQARLYRYGDEVIDSLQTGLDASAARTTPPVAPNLPGWEPRHSASFTVRRPGV